MKKWTKFETVILLLSLVGLLSMWGIYVVRDSGTGQPWRVETERTDLQKQETPEQEKGKPDSLLEGERININRAAVSELTRLPGLGPVRAQAVADHRQAHGPFDDVEGLLEVHGIGPGILEGLRPYVTVE